MLNRKNRHIRGWLGTKKEGNTKSSGQGAEARQPSGSKAMVGTADRSLFITARRSPRSRHYVAITECDAIVSILRDVHVGEHRGSIPLLVVSLVLLMLPRFLFAHSILCSLECHRRCAGPSYAPFTTNSHQDHEFKSTNSVKRE